MGSDKSQILRDFNEDDELHFFGDRMEEGGNDYSLAEEVKKRGGYVYHGRVKALAEGAREAGLIF